MVKNKLLKNWKILILLLGIFLLFDGVLSIWWGNQCLNQCVNNSNTGNIIRVIRTIGGAFLLTIYFDRLD